MLENKEPMMVNMLPKEKINGIFATIFEGHHEYHGEPLPAIKSESFREMFKGICIDKEFGVNTIFKPKHNECLVTLKYNKHHHRTDTRYAMFVNAYGRVPINDIISAMTISNCISMYLPSIDIIQWSDNFLVIVQSRYLIGNFKFFVDKQTVFDLLLEGMIL